jgi:lariat debranching enzyme
MIKIAVEGCCHGELDRIYATLDEIRVEHGTSVDLLLVCGDFECIRDYRDLASVAVPAKYRKLVSNALTWHAFLA